MTKLLNDLVRVEEHPKPVNYSHKRFGKEPVILQVTGCNFPYAYIQLGLGKPENTFLLKKNELQELVDAEIELDDIDSILGKKAGTLLDLGYQMREDEFRFRQSREVKKDENANSVDNLTPSTPEEENSLQTQMESVFSIDPGIQQRVKELFEVPDFCKKHDKGTLEEIRSIKFKHPTLGFEVERPVLTRSYACIHTGEILLSQSVEYHWRDMALINPKPGGKIIFNTFETSVETNNSLMVTKIAESTKIGFGLGFNLMPSPPAPDLSLKEGDKLFENGKPKIDPQTGNQVSVNMEYAKQYFELTLRAEARFKLVHRLQNPPHVVEMD